MLARHDGSGEKGQNNAGTQELGAGGRGVPVARCYCQNGCLGGDVPVCAVVKVVRRHCEAPCKAPRKNVFAKMLEEPS
ncbi:hypothetical protein AV530_003864 [Patagioenas fasciata monilis]|uniref:Uncharacterized protein n=1 Tax=Patagioenas fasciata monilis TaxID=372326 RepID=A0A1V4KZ28_PATFA|nr:hypothetical protein AV530_003864 [Patagioenas fasciata monilis]